MLQNEKISPSASELLKTQEVLDLLDINRSTLYRLMERGVIKPETLPANNILQRRKLRFSRTHISALVANKLD